MARKAKRSAVRRKAAKPKAKVTAKKAAKPANGMIDLYTDTTPNGYKISIFLEEAKVPYASHYVDISAGDQFKPEFLAISPNNKIPAIVDRKGPGGKPYPLFESGAILLYLAEKTGKFLPKTERGRHDVVQWLMFQMSGIGPMLGQANHFANQAPEKIPYAIQRYFDESLRLIQVIDHRLSEHDYLAGEYSIADMATYPWVIAAWPVFKSLPPERAGAMEHVGRWLERVGERPAVQKGMKVPAA